MILTVIIVNVVLLTGLIFVIISLPSDNDRKRNRKYRIKEINTNGVSKYQPQVYSFPIGWCGYHDFKYGPGATREFYTINEAKEFIQKVKDQSNKTNHYHY